MTSAVLSPDPTRCPDCRAVLTQGTTCGACGLVLTGAPAARLWQVDTELLRLDATRHQLLVERAALLAALRTGNPAMHHAGSLPAAVPTSPIQARPAEWTPKRIQNTLLGLGGLLLAIAALVFAAVTYDQLGAGGRAAVLVALTLAAGAAAPKVRGRGLTATAETLGAVTLVLAALDAYGLRKLGLAAGTDPLSYAAVSAAVLAGCSGAYARLVPLQTVRCAAVVLAQLPVLLLLARYDASAGTAGLVLAGIAAVDVGVLAGRRGRGWLAGAMGNDVRLTLVACGGAASAAGVLVSLVAAGQPGPGRAATALLAHAVVLAAAALLVQDSGARALLAGAPVPLLAVAAFALARTELPQVQQPLVLASAGLLAAQAAAQLPRSWRAGPLAGSLLVTGAAVLTVAEQIVTGLILPLTWLADPWSLPAAAGAREAVGPGMSWEGTLVTTVVLAAAAVAVGTAGLALHRLRAAALPAAMLTVGTIVLLPLGLALTYPAALALLLVLAALLAGAGAAWLSQHPDAQHPDAQLVLADAGTAVALLAAAWSTADREASLVVLPLTALGVAALSVARGLPAAAAGTAVGVAGGLGTAALASTGAAQELAADQVGGLVLVAVAALLALAAAPGLDPSRRLGAEAAAGVAGVSAALLAVGDAGWLSWVLAGTGLLGAATALRPDRRSVAAVGGLLLSASSWVRLADAGVTAPEPYVLPLAAVALILGHLRRRAVPGTRSWAAYAPGLTIALLPSLLASFDDAGLTRPLLLGLAALGVLLVGAGFRLQAPLTIGAAVLAVDALQLLAPYAAALPRWLSLGAAGMLLVAVGATYEQRRRDVSRLRESYDALA